MTPSTDWKEVAPPGEAERFEAHAVALRELQRRNAGGKPAGRALHAKGKAGLEAEFTVLPHGVEHAAVGLFATPATHRAYVRYSNGSGSRQPDTKGDVRGIAIKVLGVAGKKIIPGLEDAQTQDFLLIQSAATPFRNADEFVGFVKAAARPALLLPRAIGLFGFLGAIRLLRKLVKSVSAPVTSVATSRYYSALPIQYGPYAVHYSLAPHAQPDAAAEKGKSPDYLAEELAKRLAGGSVVYDFRVQFYCDEARTPIEDASREWKEEDAPWVTVARLTLPPQDPSSPRGRKVAAFVEGLSFDPWHATKELRPLGNMMRARNHAYRLSTQERKASPEPDGAEAFD